MDHLLHRASAGHPLLVHLGARFVAWAPGRAAIALDFRPEHCNPGGRVHGGVLAMLLDVACGYAGLFEPEAARSRRCLTLTLSLSFLAELRGPRITAIGELSGGGARIFFAAGRVVDEAGTVGATCQGSFKRLPAAP